MRKVYMVLIMLVFISGCTANIRMTDINFESQGDMKVDAAGATNTTDTGQLASADMQAIIDAVKTALKGKTSSILDTIKDAVSGKDTTDTGAAVSPANPVEEID